jgi:hypothetical protein
MDTASPDPVYSLLESLALRAVRRFGDMSASTVSGEALIMFIDFANEVIDDMRKSPYWQAGTSLPYYVHLQEFRPIPDHVMAAGLLAKFAEQQGSRNTQRYDARYYDLLNTHMMFIAIGDGSTVHELKAVDRK